MDKKQCGDGFYKFLIVMILLSILIPNFLGEFVETIKIFILVAVVVTAILLVIRFLVWIYDLLENFPQTQECFVVFGSFFLVMELIGVGFNIYKETSVETNAPPTTRTLAEEKAETAALEAELVALRNAKLANQTLKK